MIRYEDFGKDKLFLIIKDQATGKEVVSPNNDPPYWSKEREEALKKLNWAEQWNVMSKYYDIDCEHQAYKEDSAYLNKTK